VIAIAEPESRPAEADRRGREFAALYDAVFAMTTIDFGARWHLWLAVVDALSPVDPLLSTREAADLVHIGEAAVRAWCRKGLGRFDPVSRMYVIPLGRLGIHGADPFGRLSRNPKNLGPLQRVPVIANATFVRLR
jgi:hypothetical protein